VISCKNKEIGRILNIYIELREARFEEWILKM